MADESRCQNCGNAGRFTVVVVNDSVNGQWCRNACSRMCGHILAARGVEELNVSCNYRSLSTYEIRPQLTGRAAQTVHLG